MDQQILQLLWQRNELALEKMAAAYGQRLHGIAYNILGDPHDAEECVNDTYFALWNTIPPARPAHFPSFLAKVARNQALKRLEQLTAAKRNTEADLSFEELSQCLGTVPSAEEQLDELALR